MHLVLLLYLIFRLLPVFLELCSLLLLLRVVFVVSVYFLIFVLVVCSPLLLLSGRTTGYFAGQSTAVVEILQSSAPGLVMVMMMVGNNAAVAATATAANTQLQTHRTAVLMSTTGYFAGQSTAVVEILQSSAPGQQAAPLISQRLTLFFCGAAVREKRNRTDS